MTSRRRASSFALLVVAVSLAIMATPASVAHANIDKTADAQCTPVNTKCGCGEVPDQKTGKCRKVQGKEKNMHKCECKSSLKPAGGYCRAQLDCKGTWYKDQNGDKQSPKSEEDFKKAVGSLPDSSPDQPIPETPAQQIPSTDALKEDLSKASGDVAKYENALDTAAFGGDPDAVAAMEQSLAEARAAQADAFQKLNDIAGSESAQAPSAEEAIRAWEDQNQLAAERQALYQWEDNNMKAAQDAAEKQALYQWDKDQQDTFGKQDGDAKPEEQSQGIVGKIMCETFGLGCSARADPARAERLSRNALNSGQGKLICALGVCGNQFTRSQLENLRGKVIEGVRTSKFNEIEGTAYGGRNNPNDFTTASKEFPANARIIEYNPKTGDAVAVRVNDTGPFVSGRYLDTTPAALGAAKLGDLSNPDVAYMGQSGPTGYLGKFSSIDGAISAYQSMQGPSGVASGYGTPLSVGSGGIGSDYAASGYGAQPGFDYPDMSYVPPLEYPDMSYVTPYDYPDMSYVPPFDYPDMSYTPPDWSKVSYGSAFEGQYSGQQGGQPVFDYPDMSYVAPSTPSPSEFWSTEVNPGFDEGYNPSIADNAGQTRRITIGSGGSPSESVAGQIARNEQLVQDLGNWERALRTADFAVEKARIMGFAGYPAPIDTAGFEGPIDWEAYSYGDVDTPVDLSLSEPSPSDFWSTEVNPGFDEGYNPEIPLGAGEAEHELALEQARYEAEQQARSQNEADRTFADDMSRVLQQWTEEGIAKVEAAARETQEAWQKFFAEVSGNPSDADQPPQGSEPTRLEAARSALDAANRRLDDTLAEVNAAIARDAPEKERDEAAERAQKAQDVFEAAKKDYDAEVEKEGERALAEADAERKRQQEEGEAKERAQKTVTVRVVPIQPITPKQEQAPSGGNKVSGISPAPEESSRSPLPVEVPKVGNATNPSELWGDNVPPVSERGKLYDQLAREGLVPPVQQYSGREKENLDLMQGLRRREQGAPSPSGEGRGIPPPSDLGRDFYELGDRDANVRAIQETLNKNGFPVAQEGPGSPGQETDVFGPKTLKAVRDFQDANDLDPDGLVGPKTLKAMNDLSAPPERTPDAPREQSLLERLGERIATVRGLPPPSEQPGASAPQPSFADNVWNNVKEFFNFDAPEQEVVSPPYESPAPIALGNVNPDVDVDDVAPSGYGTELSAGAGGEAEHELALEQARAEVKQQVLQGVDEARAARDEAQRNAEEIRTRTSDVYGRNPDSPEAQAAAAVEERALEALDKAEDNLRKAESDLRAQNLEETQRELAQENEKGLAAYKEEKSLWQKTLDQFDTWQEAGKAAFQDALAGLQEGPPQPSFQGPEDLNPPEPQEGIVGETRPPVQESEEAAKAQEEGQPEKTAPGKAADKANERAAEIEKGQEEALKAMEKQADMYQRLEDRMVAEKAAAEKAAADAKRAEQQEKTTITANELEKRVKAVEQAINKKYKTAAEAKTASDKTLNALKSEARKLLSDPSLTKSDKDIVNRTISLLDSNTARIQGLLYLATNNPQQAAVEAGFPGAENWGLFNYPSKATQAAARRAFTNYVSNLGRGNIRLGNDILGIARRAAGR